MKKYIQKLFVLFTFLLFGERAFFAAPQVGVQTENTSDNDDFNWDSDSSSHTGDEGDQSDEGDEADQSFANQDDLEDFLGSLPSPLTLTQGISGLFPFKNNAPQQAPVDAHDDENKFASISMLPNSPKGMIVILNGTSSAGKSTIGKRLNQRLGDNWILQQVDDESLDDEIAEVRSKSQTFVDDFETVIMLKKIKKLATGGFNVLVDTVLLDKKAFDFFVSQLKKFKVFTVLVYCSPSDLNVNIQSRDNEQDSRSVNLSLEQFVRIYGRATPQSPTVDSLDRHEMRTLAQSPVFFDKESPERCSPEICLDAYMCQLGFKDDSGLPIEQRVRQIDISPRWEYDLIVYSKDLTSIADDKEKFLDILRAATSLHAHDNSIALVIYSYFSVSSVQQILDLINHNQ